MTIHLSYIKLKNDVQSNYVQTKKGWLSKDIEWSNVENLLNNSKVQFSPLQFKNGVKSKDNAQIAKTNSVIIDSDDGYMIHEFQKTYKSLKWCLGTTKSHDKDKHGLVTNRYRVIIPVLNCSDNIDIYNKAIELLFPITDKQTLTYTQAYLGNDDAVIIYNEGKILDMHNANMMAEGHLEEEAQERQARKRKRVDSDLVNSYGRLDAETVLEQVTKEVMYDVLESVGYEIVKGNIALRDERTNSTKVYENSVYDWGSGQSLNIFGLLMEYHQFSFPQALRYVNNYI